MEFLCSFPKQLLEMRFTEFIIKSFSFAKTAHIQFHTIPFQFMHQLKRADLLTFQNHPVAYGNLITLFFLLRSGGGQGIMKKNSVYR